MNLNLYKSEIEKVVKVNSFNELKNKTILVVGANGLIGSAIIDTLNILNEKMNYNIKIIGTVRNKNKILDRFKDYKSLEILEYDVNNQFNYSDKVNYIINTASNAHPIKFSTEPIDTITTNIIGTKNLLDFAVKNKTDRVLYISSGEIYGQSSEDNISFKEDYSGYIDSTNPRSCYPISKLCAENLCVSYSKQYNIDTVIARLCHTYGPTQTSSDSRVSAQFINNVLQNQDIVMKSEGSQVRSYTYVLDSVTGILTVLLFGKSTEAYNVSNNNSILSIKDMALTIAKSCNKNVIFELPDKIEKEGYNPVTRSVLDGSKLVDLGWEPLYNFDKGIESTIKILKMKK